MPADPKPVNRPFLDMVATTSNDNQLAKSIKESKRIIESHSQSDRLFSVLLVLIETCVQDVQNKNLT